MSFKFLIVYLWWEHASAMPDGVLLLYSPRDITNDCAHSNSLRYDVSFGMGMSDTVTLLFRTLNEVDYECSVQIKAEPEVVLIIVIRYPNSMWANCVWNKNAFTVIGRNHSCMELCSLIDDRSLISTYFVEVVRGRFHFRFESNATINNHINAHSYQVTATAARIIDPTESCIKRNETMCTVKDNRLCFTSGVYCDGIKNCGVFDWYDERRARCGLPVEKVGVTAVVAVVAAISLSILASCRLIVYYLPPQADSFFLFNANEDNRLCVNTHLRPPKISKTDENVRKRQSVIPVDSSTSSEGEDRKYSSTSNIDTLLNSNAREQQAKPNTNPEIPETTTRTWGLHAIDRLRARFRSLSHRGKSSSKPGNISQV